MSRDENSAGAQIICRSCYGRRGESQTVVPSVTSRERSAATARLIDCFNGEEHESPEDHAAASTREARVAQQQNERLADGMTSAGERAMAGERASAR